MSEQIEEKWFKFIRVKCKEGFIDRWMGDCADNPNNEDKSRMHLNSTATFYRLNGKNKWVSSRDFKNSINSDVGLYGAEFSATEIWIENMR